MDYFKHSKKLDAVKDRLAATVADSMDVRIALIERMDAGELTLEQVQAELKRIKRNAVGRRLDNPCAGPIGAHSKRTGVAVGDGGHGASPPSSSVIYGSIRPVLTIACSAICSSTRMPRSVSRARSHSFSPQPRIASPTSRP